MKRFLVVELLDHHTMQRIGKTFLRYEKDPYKHAERLTDSKLGNYRFRIGDYRVIFDMEGNEIVVLRIGHRSEIYRK